jgi:hypothetical protein
MARFTDFGSISHGTLKTDDLFEAFYDEAERRFPKDETFLRLKKVVDGLNEVDDETVWESFYASDYASEAVNDDLMELLGSDLPPFVYFGTHPGDGSDFGYWFDSEAFERSVSDGETLKLAELPEHPKVLANHWTGEYVAVVSDHGNVTLYSLHGLCYLGSNRAELYAVV